MPTDTTYDTPVGVGGKIDTKTGKILTGSMAGQNAAPLPVGTIPVSSLTQPAPAPAKIVTPPPATGAAGLQEGIQAQTDQFTAGLADKTASAEANKAASFQDYLKSTLGTPGQTELTANEYASTGVDSASGELKAINNQLISEQRALDKEIRSIKENAAGVYGGAQEQMIASATDKSLTRQADLAVIQMAKQGQYDSAKTIADRAVAVKMERQKTINDALKMSYEENKDLFTTAEKRQFETAQKDRERKLEMDTYKEKARYDQIIKQSDPLYAAQLVKAQADAEKARIDAGIGGKVAPTQSPLDQLKFLRETATTATNLANQSGQGKITKAIGDLVGGSKYRQLEAQTNTLRTNVLTLATDPSVKKYFGPQMSEADVRLMTAAGTTLNPENQSPQQLKDELKRLDSLFERMQTALNNGKRVEESGGKLTTAPDGTVIEIVD